MNLKTSNRIPPYPLIKRLGVEQGLCMHLHFLTNNSVYTDTHINNYMHMCSHKHKLTLLHTLHTKLYMGSYESDRVAMNPVLRYSFSDLFCSVTVGCLWIVMLTLRPSPAHMNTIS